MLGKARFHCMTDFIEGLSGMPIPRWYHFWKRYMCSDVNNATTFIGGLDIWNLKEVTDGLVYYTIVFWSHDRYHVKTFHVCQGTNQIPDVSGCKCRGDNGCFASQRYNNSMSPNCVAILVSLPKAWLDIAPTKWRQTTKANRNCFAVNWCCYDGELMRQRLKNFALFYSSTGWWFPILRGQKTLGWSFRGAAYCQLIRDIKKMKRLEWAREHLEDDFEDVVWTDETSIQLETVCVEWTKTTSQATPHGKPATLTSREHLGVRLLCSLLHPRCNLKDPCK